MTCEKMREEMSENGRRYKELWKDREQQRRSEVEKYRRYRIAAFGM